MGIVDVAAFAANDPGVVARATITLTSRWTRSPKQATGCSDPRPNDIRQLRSGLPCSQIRLDRGGNCAERLRRGREIRLITGKMDCCARAVNGHADAAPQQQL